jgi:hypothetical protein
MGAEVGNIRLAGDAAARQRAAANEGIQMRREANQRAMELYGSNEPAMNNTRPGF